MILTTSNILPDYVGTITTGASTDFPGNLTDPDFSTIYKSSDQFRLTVEFGVVPEISYIAVAGVNIAEGEKSDPSQLSRVRLYDGATLIATNQIIRDNCVVITFPPQAFTNLRIGLRNQSGLSNPICTYMAAGDYIEIPNNGEQAGYNRQFLNRSYKQKVTTSQIAAPVAVLRKRVPAKGSLPIANMTKSFTENEWQDFLDFANLNHFFIQEQQIERTTPLHGLNSSAYLCYNISSNSVTAHAQTRSLNNMTIGFNVYNGL